MTDQEVATVEMCGFCFDSLHLHFGLVNQRAFEVDSTVEFPLFVTWTKAGALRGCIGTFSAQPLRAGLQDYAITSAFRDTRFNPMTKNEIGQLECAVSLLYNFQPAKDAYDWVIGIHGIRIEFIDGSGRRYGATYLPEVAKEQGWDHDACLKSLVKKAGFTGQYNKQLVQNISLTRYCSSKAHLDHKTYLRLAQERNAFRHQ
eukprot:c18109_g1_i1.p1 GENE.c18109_g1_i1~~c18109_g1_i1.p1  ORF type:complete len:237 (+),score=48.74 c18109_g1_i1:107-712(+)